MNSESRSPDLVSPPPAQRDPFAPVEPTGVDPILGMVIAGSYEIERMLGQGGMGRVYAAKHTRLPRRAAVKFLITDSARSPEALTRFRREAEIASSLGSRHIVQVFDFGALDDGTPYMVMEFLEGEDLADRLDRLKRFPPRDLIPLLEGIVSGLSAAHGHEVIHRDIKPANIFLAKEEDGVEVVKILDFGLSKIRGIANGLTGDFAIGTPGYMSPQQLSADPGLDARTDVYAVGVTVFELLTGSRPFAHPVVTTLCQQILEQPPPSASLRCPRLTSAVDAVLIRAMAKSSDERYATVKDFWAEAKPALEGCPLQDVPAPTPAAERAIQNLPTLLSPHPKAPEPAVAAPVPVLPQAPLGKPTTPETPVAKALASEAPASAPEDVEPTLRSGKQTLSIRPPVREKTPERVELPVAPKGTPAVWLMAGVVVALALMVTGWMMQSKPPPVPTPSAPLAKPVPPPPVELLPLEDPKPVVVAAPPARGEPVTAPVVQVAPPGPVIPRVLKHVVNHLREHQGSDSQVEVHKGAAHGSNTADDALLPADSL